MPDRNDTEPASTPLDSANAPLPLPMSYDQPHRASNASVSPFLRRIYECVDGFEIYQISRTSTRTQFENNSGSLGHMRDQSLFLEPYGVPKESIRLFEIAESAAEGRERPIFDTILRDIRAGRVRLIVTAWADRLARNDRDWADLIDALKRNRGMLLIGGNFYDTTDPYSLVILGIQALISTLDNRMRMLRGITAKCSKARVLAYPLRLPSGLVWGSPADPAFAERMDIAAAEEPGIAAAWNEVLSDPSRRHRTRVVRHDKPYYVLPYPDAAVYRSMILRRDTLLRTHSLSAVIDMIRSGSEWPVGHRGEIPGTPMSFFRLDRPMHWIPIAEFRADGDIKSARQTVGDWFHSETLFGIYRFALRDLDLLPEQLIQLGARVRVANAFPSIFSPDQLSEVQRIVGRRDRTVTDRTIFHSSLNRTQPPGAAGGIAADATGGDLPLSDSEPTTGDGASASLTRVPNLGTAARMMAALPEVRCAAKLNNGDLCASKLIPSRSLSFKTNDFVYRSGACTLRHSSNSMLTSVHEDIVWDIVRQACSPAVVRRALELIDVRLGADNERLRVLARAVERTNDDLEILTAELMRAKRAQANGSARALRRALDEKAREHDEIEGEYRRARAAAIGERKVTKADTERLLVLAGNIDALYDRAATIPGARQRLLSALVRCVWVTPVAKGIDYLEIEFPTKARAGRLVAVDPPLGEQPAQAWCWLHLRHDLQGERLLHPRREQIHHARALIAQSGGWRRTRLTSPGMIRASAILFLFRPSPPDPVTALRSIETLADETNEAATDVLAVAADGLLGPAYVTSVDPSNTGLATNDGVELRFAPTAAQVALAFPKYARGTVAAAHGWEVDDVVPSDEVASLVAIWTRSAETLAKRRAALAEDDAGRRWIHFPSFARAPEGTEHAPGVFAINASTPDDGSAARRASLPTALVVPTDAALTARAQAALKIIPTLDDAVAAFRDGTTPDIVALAATLGLTDTARATLTADDFISSLDMQRLVDSVCPADAKPPMTWGSVRVSQGRHLGLYARWNRAKPRPRLYLYAPRAIRDSGDPTLIREWLEGQHGGLTPWSPSDVPKNQASGISLRLAEGKPRPRPSDPTEPK